MNMQDNKTPDDHNDAEEVSSESEFNSEETATTEVLDSSDEESSPEDNDSEEASSSGDSNSDNVEEISSTDDSNSDDVKEVSYHDEKEMSFIAHLGELRKALIVSVVSIFLAACFGFYFHDVILNSLMAQIPNKEVQFIFVSPAEAFTATLKLSVYLQKHIRIM